jgi:hypothetical protein
MTPKTWSLFVDGWNDAHGSKDGPPTADQYADLVAKYG